MNVRKSKGQAAIEYLTVFGIALLLSTPFILKAQSSIFEIRSSTGMMELQNSLDSMETVVETVSASGEPARRTIYFEVPENTVSSRIVNETVLYTVRGSGGKSTLLRSFDINITGTVPDQPGRHRVRIFAEDGKVVLEVDD